MILKFKDETVYLRINGKLVRLEAGADVELEFPKISQKEWIVKEAGRLFRCKTCKWLKHGCCTNDAKIHEDDYEKRDTVDDHLTYSYYESGSFSVGDDFGCIHWSELERVKREKK